MSAGIAAEQIRPRFFTSEGKWRVEHGISLVIFPRRNDITALPAARMLEFFSRHFRFSPRVYSAEKPPFLHMTVVPLIVGQRRSHLGRQFDDLQDSLQTAFGNKLPSPFCVHLKEPYLSSSAETGTRIQMWAEEESVLEIKTLGFPFARPALPFTPNRLLVTALSVAPQVLSEADVAGLEPRLPEIFGERFILEIPVSRLSLVYHRDSGMTQIMRRYDFVL